MLLSNCADNMQQRLGQRFNIPNEEELVNISEHLQISGTPQIIEIPESDGNNFKLSLLDEIFDSIFVVPLKIGSNFIIGEISKMEIIRDTIYILDCSTKSVHSFTMNGDHVSNFGSISDSIG